MTKKLDFNRMKIETFLITNQFIQANQSDELEKTINCFNSLNEYQLSTLLDDLKKYPTFRKLFLENLDLINAYKVTQKHSVIRTEIKYLKQIKSQLSNKPVINLINNIRKDYNNNLNIVSYNTKKIDLGEFYIKGVFPDFSFFCLFSHILNKHEFLLSDNEQFSICKKKLKEEYMRNSQNIIDKLIELNVGKAYSFEEHLFTEVEMLEKQKEDILNDNNNRVFGFIWHHNEDAGVMDLICQDIHNSNPHSGGKSIWAGGASYR